MAEGAGTAGQRPAYSAVSLFAGCGGSDLGLVMAGVYPIWANEKNEAACELYRDVTRLEAIEQCDVAQIAKFPKADILAGCYPCQGYSQGGRRNDGDGVNFLYQEFDRALRQIRPLAFIVENVDGMRFAHNRRLLDNQLVRFRTAGYTVAWAMLDAKDYGVAQDRRRVFIVGIRSRERVRFRFPKPSHGKERANPCRTLKDVIWNLRDDVPEGSFNSEPLHWYYLSRNRRRTWGGQAPCVTAHWRHVGLHPDSPPLRKRAPDEWRFARPGRARRYTYLECAAIQGFHDPHAFDGVSVRQRFRAIGNAVPPPLFAAVASALTMQLETRGSRA